MNKRSISKLMVMIVCFLFCGYPISTAAYAAEDVVTAKLEDIFKRNCSPGKSKLPDVVVTYKDGACTVKNLPTFIHTGYGPLEYFYIETGNDGIFGVVSGDSTEGAYSPEYSLIDTNKTPVTAKVIEYPFSDAKILSNGATAMLYDKTAKLFKPDGTEWISLTPAPPKGYSASVFGVDYSAQRGQYAVMYGVFPTPDNYNNYIYSKQFAYVALFDEEGKPVKQFRLKDLYYNNTIYGQDPRGPRSIYSYCRFSTDSDILYAGGMIPESIARNRDYSNTENLYDDLSEEAGFRICYGINLAEESYAGMSALPVLEVPFKIQYNKTGTYIYTKSGDKTNTLLALKGDYVALSYSINLDGSVQVIFVSEEKTGWRTHPMSK